MRIVLDLNLLNDKRPEGGGDLMRSVLLEMAGRYSGHSFLLLAPDSMETFNELPPNVSLLPVGKAPPWRWLGAGIWYRFGLPALLKRMGAGIYVASDNLFMPVLPIPGCLLLVNPDPLLQEALSKKKSHRLVRRAKAAVQHAFLVITMSGFDRLLISQLTPVATEKTRVVGLFPETKPLDLEEKELLKDRYARGLDYFVFAGDLDERHALLELLKAFSRFKKWQQSTLQLVIAGKRTAWTGEFEKLLSSYKYRDEVHLVLNPSLESTAAIIGAAHTFVYPAVAHHYPVTLLMAMQSKVPVVSSGLPVIRNLAAESISYTETPDADGFFKAMLAIYKDERLRTNVIASGVKRAGELRRSNIAALHDLLEVLCNGNS